MKNKAEIGQKLWIFKKNVPKVTKFWGQSRLLRCHLTVKLWYLDWCSRKINMSAFIWNHVWLICDGKRGWNSLKSPVSWFHPPPLYGSTKKPALVRVHNNCSTKTRYWKKNDFSKQYFRKQFTVVQKTNGTSLIYRCKMAFSNWAWRKVKVLPHLCSIKILIKDE